MSSSTMYIKMKIGRILMVEYSSVKVPTAFIERVKKLIELHPELGFRTHSEFVIDSARKELEHLENKYQNHP